MLNWVERLIQGTHTWDKFTEAPLGVYEYLERTQTEKDYYWGEYFHEN
jgi:hypothetical protein